MLLGISRHKLISSAILLIITFLIHIQNIKVNTDQLKLNPQEKR